MNRIIGIYKISNKINNRVYIGSSYNALGRWCLHLYDLISGKHKCKDLQSDFDEFGFDNLIFEIVKIFDHKLSKLELLAEEQIEMNKYDFSQLYNNYNALKEYKISADYDSFNTYMQRWILPLNKEEQKIKDYRIWKSKDKQDIVNKAIDCNMFNVCRSKYSFVRIIKWMKEHGYEIESGYTYTKNHKHTYKLIISFNEKQNRL